MFEAILICLRTTDIARRRAISAEPLRRCDPPVDGGAATHSRRCRLPRSRCWRAVGSELRHRARPRGACVLLLAWRAGTWLLSHAFGAGGRLHLRAADDALPTAALPCVRACGRVRATAALALGLAPTIGLALPTSPRHVRELISRAQPRSAWWPGLPYSPSLLAQAGALELHACTLSLTPSDVALPGKKANPLA